MNMDDIITEVSQMFHEVEQLKNSQLNKENEVKSLEYQNQKLRYRLKFLKEVSSVGYNH